jgi:hypothetical protein
MTRIHCRRTAVLFCVVLLAFAASTGRHEVENMVLNTLGWGHQHPELGGDITNRPESICHGDMLRSNGGSQIPAMVKRCFPSRLSLVDDDPW